MTRSRGRVREYNTSEQGDGGSLEGEDNYGILRISLTAQHNRTVLITSYLRYVVEQGEVKRVAGLLTISE